ncbi:O-antigen ligase family protein [Termitidicoccus mucosus]|uniref:O-antigen ligase-related domain-containing protein n=1 Tax=Termitidicoccus mucosus TaxID=1184151 RepID=A0A178IN22_9BACT|nr:hypothetical protein AW736_03880 [Opitutaceae bacterium TSB47]
MSSLAKVYLVLLSAAWIVPAWWLGGSTVSGQWILLVLAGAALAAAVWRRAVSPHDGFLRSPPDGAEDEAGASAPVPGGGIKAAAWCYGAAGLFLFYLLVQALNPAFRFSAGHPVGTLREIGHVPWLPSGIIAPFAAGWEGSPPFENPWRYLLVFGGAVALVCATTLGLNRVTLVRRWLEVMLAHAAMFSAVSLAHNLSGSRLTYWFLYDAANRLGGPVFPNGNQQGAYQLLLLAVALAALFVRSGARPFPSLPHRGVWLGAAVTLVWLGVMSGRHRAGMVLGAMLAVAAVFLAWRRAANPAVKRRVVVAAAAGVAVMLAGILTVPAWRETAARFGEVAGPRELVRGGSFRPLLHETAWLMSKDERLFGWGGGAYLYLFNEYSASVPDLAAAFERQGLHRVVFAHADSDWLEFLVEYGILGLAFLATPLVCWLGWLARRARRLPAATWMLTAGALAVFAQATLDPVFRNPVTLAALVIVFWTGVRLHQIRRAGMLAGKPGDGAHRRRAGHPRRARVSA